MFLEWNLLFKHQTYEDAGLEQRSMWIGWWRKRRREKEEKVGDLMKEREVELLQGYWVYIKGGIGSIGGEQELLVVRLPRLGIVAPHQSHDTMPV